jgi:hypothetical protein
MKGKRIGKLLTFGIMGMTILLIETFPHAEEVKFLKVKHMSSQEETGRAIQLSSRLQWERGKAQEGLGGLIRDSGPFGAIDQEMLGLGIARTAHLTWREARTQEQLGASTLASSQIRFEESGIVGRVQEQLGRVIQTNAQAGMPDSRALIAGPPAREGRTQEELGRTIARSAQLRWAEGGLALSVRDALLSPGTERSPARVSDEILNTIRREGGITHEENIRLSTTLLGGKMGEALGKVLPFIAIAKNTEPLESGWGGFAEFGFPALLAAVFGVFVFSWSWAGPDRLYPRKPEKQVIWLRPDVERDLLKAV